MKTHKIFVASVLILTAVFCFSNSAKAITVEELTAQIQALQAQLAQMQSQSASTSSGVAWCHDFNNDIRYGTTGSEVGALQSALQKENLLSANAAEISTSYFGDATALAMMAFQRKYASEVLTPYGLRNGTGYAGATTRAKLNALYGCARSATGVSALGATGTPTVKLISPNGGEQLAQGSVQTISWTSTGFATGAKALVTLLNSSGIAISSIAVNVTDTGSYAWTAPNLTGDYKVGVMVVSSSGGRLQQARDTSDNAFSISTAPARAVNLTSPKTGDVFLTGKAQTATWTSSGFSNTANVSLNLLDASYNRTPVASGIGNTGSYSWTAPTTAGSYKMSITISDGTNPAMTFTSNSFSINTAPTPTQPTITVTSPNGGETLIQGQVYNITWTSSGVSKTMIELVKGDQSWHLVYNLPAGTNNYSWTIPSVLPFGAVNQDSVGTGYKIHVWDQDHAVPEDYSDNYFTIAAASAQPSIVVSKDATSPIFQSLPVNQNVNLATFKFTNSTATAQTISQIKMHLTGTVSTTAVGNIQLLSGLTPLAMTQVGSDGIITFSGLSIPVAGYSFITLKTSANISSSAQNGATIALVINSADDVAVFQSSASGTFPVSGNLMTINNPAVQPTITVTSPNGGETWVAGTTKTISWTGQGLSTGLAVSIGIAIELLKNNGLYYSLSSCVINSINSSSGSINCNIPSSVSAGSDYKIAVIDDAKDVSDASDNYFTIAAPTVTKSVTITSPNGGESIQKGATYRIQWNATNVTDPYIKLLKNGYVQSTIAQVHGTNFFNWSVLPTLQSGSDYKIRVVDNADSTIYDDSDNYFTIAAATSCAPVWSCGTWSTCVSGQQTRTCTDANNCGTTTGKPALTQTCSTAPAVSVVSPNGGESWRVGTSQVIRWNSVNFPTNALAMINLLNTSGIAVRNIAINMANSGSYTWTVPNLPGTYKVGVLVSGFVGGVLRTATDTSDATFLIASATTGFNDTESQLASISDALAQIAQQLQNLLNK